MIRINCKTFGVRDLDCPQQKEPPQTARLYFLQKMSYQTILSAPSLFIWMIHTNHHNVQYSLQEGWFAQTIWIIYKNILYETAISFLQQVSPSWWSKLIAKKFTSGTGGHEVIPCLPQQILLCECSGASESRWLKWRQRGSWRHKEALRCHSTRLSSRWQCTWWPSVTPLCPHQEALGVTPIASQACHWG